MNFASPAMLLQFPSAYILELAYISEFKAEATNYAYAYHFCCLAITNIVFTFFYIKVAPLKFKVVDPGLLKAVPGHIKGWVLLGASLALYSPILILHSDLIFRAREIYEVTRTGFGPSYFLSSTLSFVGYAFYLCSNRRRKLEHVLFLMVCLLLTYLHGSKGQILTFAFIFLLYQVYVGGSRVGFWMSFACGSLVAIILLGLFFFFSSGIQASELYDFVISYSAYNRYAMLVLDSNHKPFWGQILMENEFFSRIPRALYPDKPKDYGTFHLAKDYFPDAYDNDQGAPAFGFGLYYADFKEYTIFFLIMTSAAGGVLARTCVEALKKNKNVLWLIMVVFFAGSGLIPTGAGYLLPEHFVLACIAAMFYKTRFRF